MRSGRSSARPPSHHCSWSDRRPRTRAACPQYTATASADLLRVNLLDPRPLGSLGLGGPLAGVRISPTRTSLTTSGAVRATAAAQYVDARLLGLRLPGGPLDVTAYQQAPPTRVAPVVRTALRRDLGPISVGTGDLRTHATWQQGYRCSGAAEASAARLDATILPDGPDRALVRIPRNLSSATATGVAVRNGIPTPTAAAAIGVADLRLFQGSGQEIAVRVLKPPTLRVYSTDATVEYGSPLVQVTLPGGRVQRLDTPGTHLDLPAPGNAAVLRLSIGDVERDARAGAVRVSAASLRIELRVAGATVLDLGIGVLDCTATGPDRHGLGRAPVDDRLAHGPAQRRSGRRRRARTISRRPTRTASVPPATTNATPAPVFGRLPWLAWPECRGGPVTVTVVPPNEPHRPDRQTSLRGVRS